MRFKLLLFLFLMGTTAWAQVSDSKAALDFDLSKAFTALEHLQYERAHALFHSVWQRTYPRKKVSAQWSAQHLFACEGLAWVYYGRLDANPDSVKYFTQATYLHHKDSFHLFRMRYLSARALLPQHPVQALGAFEQLLKSTYGEIPIHVAQIWYHIGVCYQDLKQWELAKKAFTRCLQTSADSEQWVIGRGKLPFIAHIALADVAVKMGHTKEAEQALGSAQKSKMGFQAELEFKMSKGELAILQKQFQSALLHFKTAAQILEKWVKQEQFLEADEAMLREDYASIFSNAAWCTFQLKNHADAISWVEKGKNHLMNAKLLSTPFLAEKTTFGMRDLTQLASNLAPGTTLLRYFQARDTIYALVLNRQHVKMMAVSDTNALAEHVFLLNQLDPLQIDYAEHYAFHASWIFQSFVEPLEKWLGTRHLLIIPDGALNLLAFESLCTQPKPESMSFLLEKYAIWYAPGLTFLRYAQTQPHSATQYWLGVAPNFDRHPSHLPPLLYNQKELKRVKQITGGKALLGARATKTNLMAKLNQAQYLHFSTHGVLSRNNSEENQMILAPRANSWDSLDVKTVKQLSFHGKDITLSTCYSGLSRYLLMNEEMNSLRRAFMQAGARTVLQSTWRLPDIASYLIISEYYAALKAGEDQATALQSAKLNYLHHSEALRKKYQIPADVALSPLPHHWQMIVGHGLPHRVKFAPIVSPGKWILVALGFGLLFCIWLWLWKPNRKVYF
jgi:CHAT domain-containing protein